ncbi:MAG: hypothetical protein JXD22_10180 [Sedimentisphaerales bacterium]|nr:hypothetical protein [Sedimentisphaerales bacterium]
MFKKTKIYSLILATIMLLSFTTFAQTIPEITDLSATSGPGPGEITLRWSVPIFENPSSSADFDCAYEFRTSTEPIDNGNWDQSDSTTGKLKPIIGLCASIQLDLYVSSYVDEYLIIHGDEPVLRAWLTIQYDCFNFYFPGATGLRDETIDFEIYYPGANGSLVYTGSAQTNSSGKAEISDIGDLYDDPEGLGQCSEFKFHFKAKWEGHSIGGAAGSIIVSGDKEDTVDQYLCDAQILIPPLPNWSEFGGEYHYSFPNSHCTFFVPMKALPYDKLVNVQPVISPPGPTGMRPGVTGALEAFTLEPVGQPVFATPISVSLEYVPELLTNPDQLAESSLMAYWYDIFF